MGSAKTLSLGWQLGFAGQAMLLLVLVQPGGWVDPDTIGCARGGGLC